MGIGFAALQRDPDTHLPERASSQPESPAKRLGTEVDVDPESTTLADQAVKDQCNRLRDLVVLVEELMELVDDQQGAGKRRQALDRAVAFQVLDARRTEPVAPV